MKPLNAVMIVPTGIGAQIGGHSGDANTAATIIAGVCDKLIVHPNVVNASDMNELPSNALYVDGATLDRFLQGNTNLQEVHNNHVLVVCNKESIDTINAVNAARSVLGMDISIIILNTPLIMKSTIDLHGASGDIEGILELTKQLTSINFDALAIHTPIDVSKEMSEFYKNSLRTGGVAVNPWGGVEAKLSKELSIHFNKPVAHAPVEPPGTPEEIGHPLLSPEYIGTHLMSVLRGLHRAPRLIHDIVDTIRGDSIDILISPMCWGTPHDICSKENIKIMFVTENKTTVLPGLIRTKDHIKVRSYLEAAGALVAMRHGISLYSLHRPLASVEVN